MTILRVDNLTLDIPGRRLLDDISIQVAKGTSVAVMGPSGSGKTSLLNCLAGIARPTAGRIWVNEREITFLGVSERAAMRLRNVGFVFQFGELLPELTVLDNVALPLKLRGIPWSEAESRALRQLERVGLAERWNANPDVLSGGEVQRVALARATVGEPVLILADEPTGALDDDNARLVCDVILSVAAELGSAVVMGTHNPAIAARADRQFVLGNGHLSEQAPAKALR